MLSPKSVQDFIFEESLFSFVFRSVVDRSMIQSKYPSFLRVTLSV